MAAPALAAPPPASAFGRIPAVVDAAISPDGQRVAILGGLSDQRVVSIATIDQPGLPVLPFGEVEGVGIQWAGDDYVIATIAYWESLGDQRRSFRFERQISITTNAKLGARLIPDAVLGGERVLLEQPILRVTPAPSARAMMIGLVDNAGASASNDTRIKRKGEGGAARALWRVDPATGKGALAERGNFDTRTWSVDASGEARVRTDIDEINRRFSLYGRAKGTSQWQPLITNAPYEDWSRYRGYQETDDAVLLADGDRIVLKRLADGQTSSFADAAAGETLVWDSERNVVVGVRGQGDRPVTRWIDAEVGAAAGVLGRAFKDRNVALINWSSDRSRYVARISGPTSPPAWYLYDRPRKEISLLAEEYPELKGAALGAMQSKPYKARDGLDIPAYLTLPPGLAAGEKPPLVVLAHGGPASRDDFGFDFIAQFLVSRGYAVLQPQFRGSTGFGAAFQAASRGEWGGKIQTDLLDGIGALAAAGLIDPAKVCVVGASFGGYTALSGAALHPEAYRCAASIAGMSDLGLMLNDEGRLYGRDSESVEELKTMLGGASSALLDATSPARHAADVRAPVLLVHGDKDTIVPIGQSRLMAERLKSAGKPYELVVLEGENHYLTKAANRTRTLEALERFLAKNLPVN